MGLRIKECSFCGLRKYDRYRDDSTTLSSCVLRKSNRIEEKKLKKIKPFFSVAATTRMLTSINIIEKAWYNTYPKKKKVTLALAEFAK